jgi:hypothetical protein
MEFYIKQNSTLPILKMEIIKDGRSDFNLNSFLSGSSTFLISLYDKSNDRFLFASKECYVSSDYSEFEGKDLYYLNYQFTNKDTLKTGRYEVQVSITSEQGVIILPLQDKYYVNVLESFSLNDLSYNTLYESNLPCCGFQQTFEVDGITLDAYYYSGSLIIDYILTTSKIYNQDITVNFTNVLEVYTGTSVEVITGVTIPSGEYRGTTKIIFTGYDYDNLTQTSYLKNIKIQESFLGIVFNFNESVVFDTPPPTQTPTKTPTPSVTVTKTPTSSINPTPSVTVTKTQTPTNTPTVTVTSTPTPSITSTKTSTPSITPTNSPTNSPTSSVTTTNTPTNTPTPTTNTATNTPSVTPTNTPTPSVTPTNTPTPSVTKTQTPTITPTPTVTPTSGATPSCPYEVGYFNTLGNVMRFNINTIYDGNIYVVTRGGTQVYDTSYNYIQTIPNSFTAGTPSYASIVFAEDNTGPSPLSYVFDGGDTNNKSIDVFELNGSTSSLINVGTSIGEMAVSKNQDVVGYLMPDSGLYGQIVVSALTLGFTIDVSATTNGDISLSRLDDKFWIVSTGDTIIKVVPGGKVIDSTVSIPSGGYPGYIKTILDDPTNGYTYLLVSGQGLFVYDSPSTVATYVDLTPYSGTNTSMTIDEINNKLYILNVQSPDIFGLIKVDIGTLSDEGLFNLSTFTGFNNGYLVYEPNNSEILLSFIPYAGRIYRFCT